MSFNTIFVCIGPQWVNPTVNDPLAQRKLSTNVDVCWVASQLDATEALKEIQLWCTPPGEVYACKLSESAAKEIRDAVEIPRDMPRGKPPVSALTLLKRYSLSMQKCADLT